MSKTNHTSYGAAATSERELTIDELEHVSSGGLFNYGHIEWTYYPQKADGTARV